MEDGKPSGRMVQPGGFFYASPCIIECGAVSMVCRAAMKPTTRRSNIMYVCNNDRYCDEATTFESCAEFVSYCQAVFNERPALISRNCGDQYVDELGTVVLSIVSEEVR